MRPTVNRFVARRVARSATIGLLSCGLACCLATAAGAEAEDPAGEDRWVPSLALRGEVLMQRQESSLGAFGAEGRPATSPLSDDDLALAAIVGASLQLETPRLALPGRPRLFASGSILPMFAPERDIVKEGDPQGFSLPAIGNNVDPDTGLPRSGYAEARIGGQGSKTAADFRQLGFAAAVGLAFPFDLWGRRLRVKPAVGWMQYEIEVKGIVLQADCLDTPQDGNQCIDFDQQDIPPFLIFPPVDGAQRLIRLEGSDEQVFHGIGPSLEIELDTGRFGPLGTSVFLGAQAYRIVNDREIAFSATTGPLDDELAAKCTDCPVGPITADWTFEVNPWVFRTGVGIRFQWLGRRR